MDWIGWDGNLCTHLFYEHRFAVLINWAPPYNLFLHWPMMKNSCCKPESADVLHIWDMYFIYLWGRVPKIWKVFFTKPSLEPIIIIIIVSDLIGQTALLDTHALTWSPKLDHIWVNIQNTGTKYI